MTKSRTAYALLGFLTWRPMSGYELKQSIARSVGNFWSEGDGQIYPMLRRMADNGWITSRAAAGAGRRPQRVHEITAAGREALREWLCAPVSEPPPRVEILLKLFFGGEAPLAVSTTHVEAARAEAAYKLSHLQAIAHDLHRRPGDDPRMPFWSLTVDYGLAVARARLGWCDRALAELQRLAGTDRNDRHPASLVETGRQDQPAEETGSDAHTVKGRVAR